MRRRIYACVGSAEGPFGERSQGEGGREGGGCDHDKVHTGIVRGTRSHDYRRLGTELTNRIVNFSAEVDRARLRDVKSTASKLKKPLREN